MDGNDDITMSECPESSVNPAAMGDCSEPSGDLVTESERPFPSETPGLTGAPLRDRDIREPLFDWLEETYGKNRILEEKTMGRSRADVVMVLPDRLVGIEIKSDVDTYVRLADQVKDYDSFYDQNIVVVGSHHGLHITEHVPEYWGIITAERSGSGIDFYYLRRPKANPKMKWKKKLKLLWRPELAELQAMNGMPKYREKSKAFVIGKIAETVEPPKRKRVKTSTKAAGEKNGESAEEELLRSRAEILNRQISDILFERDYSTIADRLEEYRKAHRR